MTKEVEKELDQYLQMRRNRLNDKQVSLLGLDRSYTLQAGITAIWIRQFWEMKMENKETLCYT